MIQAVSKSEDPEATKERIESFTNTNIIKGTAIMVLGFGAVISYSAANPYVPPGL